MATVRLRRMGKILRALREERGWTLEAAAPRLERTASSLSKIELGYQHLRKPELLYILNEYGVTDETLRAQLFSLAKARKSEGWWQKYRGVLPPDLIDYISLEADARTISSFDGLHLPGIVQTIGYTRAMLAAGSSDPRKQECFLKVRQERQQILTREQPPTMWLLLGEATLRQMVGGPDVMRGQLARLDEVARLAHVRLQIVPFSAGAHPGLDGSFIQMKIGEQGELNVVLVESQSHAWYLEEDHDVDHYNAVFAKLTDVALTESDSRKLIWDIWSQL